MVDSPIAEHLASLTDLLVKSWVRNSFYKRLPLLSLRLAFTTEAPPVMTIAAGSQTVLQEDARLSVFYLSKALRTNLFPNKNSPYLCALE